MEQSSLPGAATAAAPQQAGEPRPAAAEAEHGVDTTADLIAGWMGGAVGVIAGNPFEVLKVRLQTSQQSHHPSAPSSTTLPNSPRVGKSSTSPIMLPSLSAVQSGNAPLPNVASPAAQTSATLRQPAPSVSVPPSTTPAPPSSAHQQHQHQHHQPREKPSIMSLYRSEGVRFFFAGAAGPILGLAFIDSAFFGLYGRVMQQLGQDRQDPNALHRVFIAGAAAGAACSILETPIEVVKTRAQTESSSGPNQPKLGSFRIARLIAAKEGLRGFYVGGGMTALHDGFSSGIFFAAYFIFRRLLRGEDPFHPSSLAPSPSSPSLASASASASASSAAATLAPQDTPTPIPSSARTMDRAEIGRIMLAGGLAGALSALIPYPFDIVKTRLQTANFESKARSSHATPSHSPTSCSSSSSSPAPNPRPDAQARKLTVAEVFRGIHADGVNRYRYRYHSTFLYQLLSSRVFPPPSSSPSSSSSSALVDGRPRPNPKAEKWALRVLGLKGFANGLRPTVVSSFVGSAATITTVEIALHLMGVNGGGGGVG
ncbi:hypothetical protein JCM1840_005577 [Sporobolomyces johnsonii]